MEWKIGLKKWLAGMHLLLVNCSESRTPVDGPLEQLTSLTSSPRRRLFATVPAPSLHVLDQAAEQEDVDALEVPLGRLALEARDRVPERVDRAERREARRVQLPRVPLLDPLDRRTTDLVPVRRVVRAALEETLQLGLGVQGVNSRLSLALRFERLSGRGLPAQKAHRRDDCLWLAA